MSSIVARLVGAIVSAAEKTFLSGSQANMIVTADEQLVKVSSGVLADAGFSRLRIAPLLQPTYLSYDGVNAAYLTAVGSAAATAALASIKHGGSYYWATYDSDTPAWYLINVATGAVTGLIDYKTVVLGLSPTAYWPMTETSGTTADNAEGTAALDGTYNGPTLASVAGPDGDPAPLFDGLNDYLSTPIAAYNSMSLFSISAWVKVSSASVWSDGQTRVVVVARSNANNRINIFKVSNLIQIQYVAGGVAKTINTPAQSDTDWHHVGVTVDAGNDRMLAFFDGAQVGSTQNGLGVFAGALDSDRTAIGADTISSPTLVWDGYIGQVSVFPTEKSPANMATLGAATT